MLKVGIFGVGHLGKYHLANWQQMTGVEVVGFYDPSDKMAQEVSENFSLPGSSTPTH
jgi:predicted dehydrogenase